MKKIFLLLFAELLISYAAKSQGKTYTQAMDSVMFTTNKNQITTGILYDRVFPWAGLHTFNRVHPDTSSYVHFIQAYSEIYNSTYNKSGKTSVEKLDTVIQAVAYTNNVIPIGVMYYDYNLIDTNSLSNNLFFLASDSSLHDVQGRTGNPYLLKTVGIAAALIVDSLPYGTGTVAFQFVNSLFLTNKNVSISSMYADFGSGNQSISGGAPVSFNYTSGGIKKIKFTINFSNNSQIVTYSSLSIASRGIGFVLPDDRLTIFDTQNGFQGYDENVKKYNNGTYGIYYHRTSPGGPIERLIKKPIIIIDGFDPKDQRSDVDIYNDLLLYPSNKNLGSDMRDLGYDIIILNFPTITERTIPIGPFNFPVKRYQGGDYIERNGLLLVSLIEKINQQLTTNGSTEKLVVIGPSMGGLISHYALKWMENNNKNHNTRLWISFDSPQKGANVPIGDQWFLDFFARQTGIQNLKEARDLQLNCPASKQQLLHHYLSGSITPAGAPNFRDRWQQSLDQLGYPNKNKYGIRNISLDNGAVDGTTNGQACQQVVHMESALQIRVLFIKLNLIKIANGNIFFAGSNSNQCKVFDGWAWIFFNNNSYFASASSSSKSYDIVPGGTRPAQQELAGKGGGFEAFVGFSWLGIGSQTKFDVFKPDHCFIPLKSALGMNLTGTDLAENLYNRNLVCTGETPFDSYYAPFTNEHHNELTPSNVAWLKEEIAGNPQQPTTSVTLNISGDDIICGTSNPYTISSLPTGATVTWSAKPLGIVTINSPTSTQTTLTSNSNGAITLTAKMSNVCGVTFTAKKPVAVGPPVVNISYSKFGGCHGTYQTWSLNATSPNTVSSWLWTVDHPEYGSWYIYNPNSANTLVDVSGGGGISVTASNSCGSTRQGVTIYSSCTFGIIASPNPSTGDITVSTDQGKTLPATHKPYKIYKIFIADQVGNIKKRFNYNAGITNVTLNLKDLISGGYTIKAFNGIEWSSQRIIISR